MRLGLDLGHDLGTPRLTWGRLAAIVAHTREGDALYEALTDGAPTLQERFWQSMDLSMRRMVWLWGTSEESKVPEPQPILLPADRRAEAKREAAAAAREGQLLSELQLARARRAERLARIEEQQQVSVDSLEESHDIGSGDEQAATADDD